VAKLASLTVVLSAVGVFFESGSPGLMVGHLITGLIVLILLIYHARRVRQSPPRQYQAEVFVMWLTVTITYLALMSVMDEIYYDPTAVCLGSMVMFWLPSAVLGVVVLGLARRRALKSEQ
jgi:hypothetical protein